MSRQPSTPGGPTQQPLDSSFLPLAPAADEVQFNLVDDATGHHDQEATLEALRQALSTPAPGDIPQSGEDMTTPTLVPANQVQVASINKAVAQLTQLTAANQAIIDQMDPQRILQGLMGSFRLLQEGHKRQAELVRNIISSIEGRGPPTIDPAFAVSYVPRSEYDALKARYDSLVSTSSAPTRRARSSMKHTATMDDGDEHLRDANSVTPFVDDEKRSGRKRRSMKLEHLVHKMANRRLGVEYPVQSFDSKGSRELPDPASIPPTADASINGVDEYRPDFRADVASATVRPFLDQVISDVRTAWSEGFEREEPDVDDEQIVKSVHTYWTRLGKRYDEQLSRERGEVHKDELTRRKQNQYRRQQSLVARRTAAFDSSPLNLCKARALYRTLLTIDFAAMTNERPDPKRAYTEDEWNAYRKQQCGARANEAHEVVDQFWLSPAARNLLTILDVYAQDQSSRQRRKGRPKQPAPTFHLPQELWDRSNLPQIRQKDAEGLPIPNTSGIILFRFHVDDKVQAAFPEWAADLYDNPPVPDEDNLLPNLPDVMNANAFFHLRPKIKQAVDNATITQLSAEEVQEVLNRADTDQDTLLEETGAAVAAAAAAADNDVPFDLASADFMSARGLESIVAMASGHLMGNPFASPSAPSASAPPPLAPHTQHPLLPLGVEFASATAGPSPGSSVRARKQAKRMMSELPGGAATPVPKKRRAGDPEPQEVDLSGDTSFLDSL